MSQGLSWWRASRWGEQECPTRPLAQGSAVFSGDGRKRKGSSSHGRKSLHKKQRQVLKARTASMMLRLKARGPPPQSSGRESICQCRGHGFDLCSGKIPHAVDQLSPHATTSETQASYSLCSAKREATCSEKPLHHNEREAPAHCN